MTEIKAFKALVYNQEKIKDMSKVVCPPYDVISSSQQDFLMALDEHNLIHILLSKESAGEDKYKKAGEDFNRWIKDNVFCRDEAPAIYFYSQQYSIKGEKKTRLGIIALLKLPEHGSGVFKHEHTRSEPKEDRLKLTRQVKANLSPIFAIFPDKKRMIQFINSKIAGKEKPFIDITDTEKVTHKLWRVDSPDIVALVEKNLRGENIFIADGHHRFEVACMYRDEMAREAGKLSGEEGFNYVLAYLTNTDSRGLTIMPINRFVKTTAGFDMERFIADLCEYFDVEQVKEKNKFFLYLNKAGSSTHIIGMHNDSKFWLLRLKNVKLLEKLIPDKNREYRSLDVAILNYIILKKIMGMDIEDKQNIVYSHDIQDLISMSERPGAGISFFLNPVKMEQIMAVALTGEKMPSKSTFFYPKVLSGLVINKFK